MHARREYHLLLFIAYLGFISLGLPDAVIGVAWPSVRDVFNRQQGDIAFIFAGTGIGYFLSSVFTGRLLMRMHVGTLLAGSSALVAIGGFGYGLAPLWVFFGLSSILHGMGSGAIDSGLNHYVAKHFSARHMNWLHAFYCLGAMLGPLILTGLMALQASWRMGYLAVAISLAALSLLFAATRHRWNQPNQKTPPEGAHARSAGVAETLRHRAVRLHLLLFFLYTGLEVSIGQWSFTILTESRLVRKELAGLSATIYWASIGVGRVLLGFVVERVGIDRLLRASAVMALSGTMLFASSTDLSILALALIGLSLAPIYPCLMSRTPARVGTDLAAHTIGFQSCAAMIGAVSLPSLFGVLAERFGLEAIALGAVMVALIFLILHERVLGLGA